MKYTLLEAYGREALAESGSIMGQQTYSYLLAKSIVRMRAERFELWDRVLETEHIVPEATLEILTVADNSSSQRLPLPSPDADITSALVFRPDRRISSIEVASTGRGPARLKAGAALVGMGLGAVLAVGNPLALPGQLGASLQGTISQKSRTLTRDHTLLEAQSEEDDPLLAAYGRKFPTECTLLRKYRAALATLLEQHATAAEAGDDEKLERTSRSLTLTRRQSGSLEDHFIGWRLDSIERRSLGLTVEELDITELPTSHELLSIVRPYGRVGAPKRDLSTRWEPWIQWARNYGITLSVDWNGRPLEPEDLSENGHEIRITYRPAQEALVTTWKVELVQQDASGARDVEQEPTEYLVTSSAKSSHRLVRADTAPVTLSLDADAWTTGKLRATFNELGEPEEVGGESVSGIPDTLRDLSTHAKEGVDAGTTLATALTPGSATAAALERELQIAKGRKELSALISPNEPDAEAKKLKNLKGEVERAELEARLQLARAQSLRGSGTPLVVYTIPGAGA